MEQNLRAGQLAGGGRPTPPPPPGYGPGCIYLVQVHVVGGTDQGVAQLQQEFFPDVEAKISPAVISLEYTISKGVGLTKTVWDSVSYPLFTLGLPYSTSGGGLGVVQWLAYKPMGL